VCRASVRNSAHPFRAPRNARASIRDSAHPIRAPGKASADGGTRVSGSLSVRARARGSVFGYNNAHVHERASPLVNYHYIVYD
jgi:hypothetical protein